MIMKKLMICVGAAVFAGIMVLTLWLSCGSGNETERLKNSRDSLDHANEQKQDIIDELTTTLADVSTCLDSVAIGQSMIRKAAGDGNQISRQEMLANIRTLKDMLDENKNKLSELEKQLKGRNDKIGKLSALVEHLQRELSTREATIAQMEEIIKQQDLDIRDLESQLEASNSTIADMEEENVQQREQLASQDAAMNTVYYTVGSDNQLKQMGLLAGGFLKKAKLDVASIKKEQFTRADKRTLTEIIVPTKSAKVLTSQPADAYTIEARGNSGCVLKITNPARFWSVSTVLVVEAK